MQNTQDIKILDDLNEKFSTWIIKYISTSFENSIFLIWYTDSDVNSTNKLLKFKSGQIFSTNSLTDFKKILLTEIDNLEVFDNLIPWLENLNEIQLIESCTYDLCTIKNSIDKNNLDITTIENFANFIDLYDDFVNQDLTNNRLKVYLETEEIQKTWTYFYNYIFWPRFNDKNKFEKWDRPKLEINNLELLKNLKDLSEIFENNIKLTEKAIC